MCMQAEGRKGLERNQRREYMIVGFFTVFLFHAIVPSPNLRLYLVSLFYICLLFLSHSHLHFLSTQNSSLLFPFFLPFWFYFLSRSPVPPCPNPLFFPLLLLRTYSHLFLIFLTPPPLINCVLLLFICLFSLLCFLFLAVIFLLHLLFYTLFLVFNIST